MLSRYRHLLGLGYGLLMCVAAGAHPSPHSEVLLISEPASIRVELVLPLAELQLAWKHTLLAPSGGTHTKPQALVTDTELAAYLAAHIRPTAPDGRAWVVKVDRLSWQLAQQPTDLLATLTLRPPAGAPLDHFTFSDDAISHAVPSHLTMVSLRTGADAPARLLGTLRFGLRSLDVRTADARWWTGCGDLFRLGMAHIAEGSDHLLFLLTMLLPAALLARDGHWHGYAGARHLLRYLLTVVTAFTAGHSLTLILGAAGAVRLPTQPVEFAIAASILVAALHAWRPLFPRREGWIAAAFGLVHGLAFASALSELQLRGARLATGVLAFNLGIETVQAVIVLLAAPLLILLARTVIYTQLRGVAAAFAASMAVLWMAQRV